MKRVVGQRARRVGVEEEETDAGEEKESTTKDVRSTEEKEDAAESVLPRGEEETINPRPLDSQDEKRKGQRARCVGVEEEETDAEEEKESTTKDVGSMEEKKDAEESVLPRGEEETINPRPLDSQDEIRKGEGDSKEQQLCHVPGGAWLQQAHAVTSSDADLGTTRAMSRSRQADTPRHATLLLIDPLLAV
ncbi:hypothetical protein NDU88_007199 [Pleurodeles waltl]|uniref:Uncharacterized protein n=1 Tax=Pleurodeles waltl TaxID=8319 RepID=A0AAV7PTE2_PLEWA|nr:hypothetical protein NDU88_007199 [Pleurodeles waltl]